MALLSYLSFAFRTRLENVCIDFVKCLEFDTSSSAGAVLSPLCSGDSGGGQKTHFSGHLSGKVTFTEFCTTKSWENHAVFPSRHSIPKG